MTTFYYAIDNSPWERCNASTLDQAMRIAEAHCRYTGATLYVGQRIDGQIIMVAERRSSECSCPTWTDLSGARPRPLHAQNPDTCR